jgi:hypothetical protein
MWKNMLAQGGDAFIRSQGGPRYALSSFWQGQSIGLQTRGHEKSRRHLPAPRSAAVAAVVPRSLSFSLFNASAVDKKKREETHPFPTVF